MSVAMGHGMRSNQTRSLAAIIGIGCSFITGCISGQTMAAQRASRELACPIGDVVVTQRPEISSEIYDVEGCRQRARYSCFHERYGTHCVREPDPR